MVVRGGAGYDQGVFFAPIRGESNVTQSMSKFFARVVSTMLVWTVSLPVVALELRRFDVAGQNDALREALVSASLVAALVDDAAVTPRGIVAAAQADYARLLRILYAHGHYSG